MATRRLVRPVSRRTALASLGVAGLALAAGGHAATARHDTGSLAGHPNAGVWKVDSPIEMAVAVYSPDGSVVTALPASQVGPAGV